MYRAQILIEEWQHQELKSMAERQGRSVSEIVREILADRFKSRRRRKSRLEDIQGIISDPNLSGRDHDRIIYGLAKR